LVQYLFERAEALVLSEAQYQVILAQNQALAGRQGIDAVLRKYRLDALVAPTGAPAWQMEPSRLDNFLGGCSSPAAMAGYPLITAPAGFVGDLPVGITFMGGAFSEPTLIRLAYAFEQRTRHRQPPRLSSSTRYN
jgi:amidase